MSEEYFSRNRWEVKLANGDSLEIRYDILFNWVAVKPPVPVPKARLLVTTTHELGFGHVGVLQIEQIGDHLPNPQKM